MYVCTLAYVRKKVILKIKKWCQQKIFFCQYIKYKNDAGKRYSFAGMFFFQFCDTSCMYLVEYWPNSPYSLCAGLERFLTLKLRSRDWEPTALFVPGRKFWFLSRKPVPIPILEEFPQNSWLSLSHGWGSCLRPRGGCERVKSIEDDGRYV